MDRDKLSRLIKAKQEELQMNQVEFAQHFSSLVKKPVSYGWVQSVTNPKKDSVPDWENMVGIAKLWKVGLDELHEYLENPSVESIYDVSTLYKKATSQTMDVSMTWKIIEPMTSEEKSSLMKLLLDDLLGSLTRLTTLEAKLLRLKEEL
jgi:hypothetical protein